MRRVPPRLGALFVVAALLAAIVVRADDRVRFVGHSNPAYMARKFQDGKPRRETYVFAAGQRFDGGTADHTFDRTTVRQIAEMLAPSLTRQNYWPTKELADADLLLVVHWGVTLPQAPMSDLTARTTYNYYVPENTVFADSQATADIEALIGKLDYVADDERYDQFSQLAERNAQDIKDRGTAGLLGYTGTLAYYDHKMGNSAQQYTLLWDLRSERYFVIVRAFDLKARTQAGRSHAVWTLYLNISSPGNNFTTAVSLMSQAGAPHFGHDTGLVGTARPTVRPARVELGDMIILGEGKNLSKPAGNVTARTDEDH